MSHLKNWQEEKRSSYLYEIIAKREIDPVRKKLFGELAGIAEKQATIWESNIEDKKSLHFRLDMRTRIVGALLKYLGPKQMRFILSAMKVRGMSIYSSAPTSHAEATYLEHKHKGLNTAGNLRAAVFGVNDGLVSNMSLLLGIVGGGGTHDFIILSGVAGLLAGACSMATGEFVSVRSQKEFFEYQIALEKEELELYPEEEADELACIYRARGLPPEDAERLAKQMISNPNTALDTLAREELGLNPDELGSPMGAAVYSFLSFAFGAFIPLVPFLYWRHAHTILLSMTLTAITLTTIGATLSLYTNRSAWWGGLRMLLIGAASGAATYSIGHLVGKIIY